ncbi:MAG TPA: DNA-binding protein [Candidatus Eisenbacteria bacterium]
MRRPWGRPAGPPRAAAFAALAGLAAAAALGAFASAALAGSLAPSWSGRGGWGPRDPYQLNWNSEAVETVAGDVVRIDRIRPLRGMEPGVALFLATPRARLVVHLGPAWYLDRQELRIGKGDHLVIRGSLVAIDGQLTLIAERVARGRDALALRDGDGMPAWDALRRP